MMLGTRLSFLSDDWDFLYQRPGLESHGGIDTLLAPHNGNLVALVELLYKGLITVFGLGSLVPYRLVLAAAVMGVAVTVYVIVSARVGAPLGIMAAAIIMFLGPASEVLLFFGGANHAIATGLGLAALIALERPDGRRDVLALLALTAAVSASSTGLSFVAGAAIAILLTRTPAQLWIPAVPAAAFGAWWAGYGHRDPSGVTAARIVHLPVYVLQAISSGLASAFGLNHAALPLTLQRGYPLTVIAVLALGWWLWRGGRPRPWAAVFAGAALAFWMLTGAAASPGREAIASRYQLVDVSLLLVLGAELAHGWRPRGRLLWAIVALTTAIVVSNLVSLRDGYDSYRVEAGVMRADLGALQLAHPHIGTRALQLTANVTGNPYTLGITASRYFAETARHGSPAFDSPQQIAAALLPQRASADGVLIAAYGVRLRTGAGLARTGLRCRRLTLAAVPVSAAVTTRALVADHATAPLIVSAARFGPPTSHVVGLLLAGQTGALTIPRDRATTPWTVRITSLRPAASSAATLCTS